MKKRIQNLFIFFCFFYCIIFFVSEALAVKTPDLYAAQVAVPSNGVNDRWQTLPHALVAVLTKVSGKKDIANNSCVKNRLASASAYLASYNYVTRDFGNGVKNFYLHANFNPGLINQILNECGESVWSGNRPLFLALIATPKVDDQNTSAIKILNEEDNLEPVVLALKDNAMQKGIPLIFPEASNKDASFITTTDVCSFNKDALRVIAKQHGANALLLGCLSKDSSGVWAGQWQVNLYGAEENLALSDQDVNALAVMVMDNIFDKMARHAILNTTSSQSRDIVVNISGIGQLKSYADLIKYVRSLNSVVAVNLDEVSADSIVLRVRNQGGVKVLQEAIGVEEKLILEKASKSSSAASLHDESFLQGAGSNYFDKAETKNGIAQEGSEKMSEDALYYRWNGGKE